MGRYLSSEQSDPRIIMPLFGAPLKAPDRVGECYADMLDGLGANAVIICVGQDDWLYTRPNVARLAEICRGKGLRTYISLWGLFGGESLWFAPGHYDLTGEAWSVNEVLEYGTDPSCFRDHPVTRGTEFFLRRFIKFAYECKANMIFWDEVCLSSDGCDEHLTIPYAEFCRVTRYAASLGLGNSVSLVSVSARYEADVSWMARICDVREYAQIAYYGPDEYQPPPEEYQGTRIDRLRGMLASANRRDADVLAWVQGFDLGDRGDLIVEGARVAARHKARHMGIWGGPCVDDVPQRKPHVPGQYDTGIIEAVSLFRRLVTPMPEALSSYRRPHQAQAGTRLTGHPCGPGPAAARAP